MATWKAVQQYLVQNFGAEGVTDRIMAATLDMPAGRSQQVLVTFQDHEATGGWVRVASKIGFPADLDLLEAAMTASDSLCGGIVVIGDYAYLRHSIPLENLDSNELHHPINIVALGADNIEKLQLGTDEF